MTVNYTSLLSLGQPVTGTESGTWGNVVNNSLSSYLDIAIAGTLTLTGDGPVTLSNTQGTNSATNIGSTTAQYYLLKVEGTLSGTKVITAPSVSKTYIVINTSNQSATIKASGQTGVTVAAGTQALVAFNGTDYVSVGGGGGSGAFTNLSVSGTATFSGGTANGVAYLNGSKELTTGGTFVFNGTNVGIGTNSPGSKLTVAGLIETTTGGVKFPDGTIQTTAGGGGGSTDWANPGTIGSSTPNTAVFTSALGKGSALGHCVDAYPGADDQEKIVNAITAALAGTNGSNIVVFNARLYDIDASAVKSIVIDLAGKGIVLQGTSQLGSTTTRTRLKGAGGQTLLQIKDTTGSANSYFAIRDLNLYTESGAPDTVGLQIGSASNNWATGSFAYSEITNVFIYQFITGLFITNTRHIVVSNCTIRRQESGTDSCTSMIIKSGTYGTNDILFSKCDFDVFPKNNSTDVAVKIWGNGLGKLSNISFVQCYFYFGSLACVQILQETLNRTLEEIHFLHCQFDFGEANLDPDAHGLHIQCGNGINSGGKISRIWVDGCWFYGYPVAVFLKSDQVNATIDSINVTGNIITGGVTGGGIAVQVYAPRNPNPPYNYVCSPVDTLVIANNILRGMSFPATNNVTTINGVTSNVISTAGNHNMVEGQQFYLSGATPPTGLTNAVVYFARDVTATTFKVTETYGGAVVSLTNGTGLGDSINYYRDGVAIDLQYTVNAVVQSNTHYASNTGNNNEKVIGIGYFIKVDSGCENFVVANNVGDTNYALIKDDSTTNAKTITGNLTRYARGNTKGSSTLNWTKIVVPDGQPFNIEGATSGGFSGYVLVRDYSNGLFSGTFDVGAGAYTKLSDSGAAYAQFGGGSPPSPGWWITKTSTGTTPPGSDGRGLQIFNNTGSSKTIDVAIFASTDASMFPF